MSSMLEQAIVDAKSLREAAIRNAEETLVEKYSDDIKEAVEKLLEQDEEMMGMASDPMAAEEDVPLELAATEGEDLCPCPDEGEQTEIVLNLDDIAASLNAMDQGGSPEEIGMPQPHPEPEEMGLMEEEIEISDNELKSLVEQMSPDVSADVSAAMRQAQQAVPDMDMDMPTDLDEEENFDLTEQELAELLEKVIVDMAPVGASWAGRPVAEREFEEDKHKAVLAQEHDIDVLKQENKKLEGQILKLQGSIKEFKSRENKYNEVVNSLKQRFDEMSLANARLVYTNKVLNSDSLNERQKQKVADAISNVNSVEEAKVIFEALQNAVGSTPNRRRGPKSLNEAVEKRSSSLLASRRNKRRQSDVPDGAKSRMQRLAGIK